jgi:hypothetical protein
MMMSPTGFPGSDGLRALYERSPDGPLTKGDLVNGVLVIGFGFAMEPDPFSRDNDRLLLAGDESRAQVPPRRLPTRLDEENGTRVERCGPHVAQRLHPRNLTSPDDVAPQLPAAVDRAISRDPSTAPFIRSFVGEFRERAHSIWLIGGAVRDLLTNAAGPLNDLDFAGTMLLGELWEVLAELLARTGLGDHRPQVSLRGVFSVPAVDRGGDRDRDRIIEYKSLSQDGFRFPASGGDLVDDVASRDLTVNGLYYDPHLRLIIDPSGRGIEDLRAVPRKIVPLYSGPDPVEQAQIVLRGLKFAVRWPDADISQLEAWVKALPSDLTDRIPEGRWRGLRGMWKHSIPKKTETEVAGKLGPVAVDLVRLLGNGGDDAA